MGNPVANGGRPGRPEGPLDPASGAVANLAARLRQLRDDAGRPSYRQLARTAYYSHSALSQAAAGRDLPSLAVTLAFVRACGGDQQEWTAHWHEAAADAGMLTEQDATPAAAAAGRRRIRFRLARIRRRGWYPLAAACLAAATLAAATLAAAGLGGGLLWRQASGVATTPPTAITPPTAPATHVIRLTGGLAAPVADGDVPSVADCTSWTKSLSSREVLAADGHVLGTLRLRYSMRCAAVWARFDPGPSLSAAHAVTITLEVIRHPDGKTMKSTAWHVGHLQRSDILLLSAGCAQATVTVTRPGQAPATAATSCQPPP